MAERAWPIKVLGIIGRATDSLRSLRNNSYHSCETVLTQLAGHGPGAPADVRLGFPCEHQCGRMPRSRPQQLPHPCGLSSEVVTLPARW